MTLTILIVENRIRLGLFLYLILSTAARTNSLRTKATGTCMNPLFVYVCAAFKEREREGSIKGLPQQNLDSDIWVSDYLTPSWVCLPNNQPILAIVQPGETALDVLSTACKVSRC